MMSRRLTSPACFPRPGTANERFLCNTKLHDAASVLPLALMQTLLEEQLELAWILMTHHLIGSMRWAPSSYNTTAPESGVRGW